MTIDPVEQALGPRSVASAFLILVCGALVAAWIGFGRFPFGVNGSLTPLYIFIALLIVVLQMFTAQAVFFTARRGFVTRRATYTVVILSWVSGLLCGLTLPDLTDNGMQTIVSGPHEPGLGIAIGVTNPAGIICIILSVAAVILAVRDSRGKEKYDEDAVLDAIERSQQQSP